jgi:uncharacterized protein (DUF697 family)
LNLHRIFGFATAIAAVATATAVCLVAAALAVYALVLPHLGAAWAAAAVAGIFAVLAIIVAAVMSRKAKGKPALGPRHDENLVTKAMTLARERPFVAAAVGALGAVILIRNPAIISTLISAAIAGRASRPER